ncbi:MAG: hypothetical protein V4663_06090 [Bacteroidota bacterium]
MTDIEILNAISKDMIIVCTGKFRKVLFEPKKYNLKEDGGFVDAIDYCNSNFLSNGKLSHFTANIESCRIATTKEIKWYRALKKHSKHVKISA